MTKKAVFTMKLEPELRAQFMAEAQAADRPASQVLREFVQRALHGIGFGGVSQTLPPGSMRVADLQSSASQG